MVQPDLSQLDQLSLASPRDRYIEYELWMAGVNAGMSPLPGGMQV